MACGMRENKCVVRSTNPLREQCDEEVLAPEAPDLLDLVLLNTKAL